MPGFMPRRLLWVGLGRHAERIYLPLIAEAVNSGEVILTGVADLRSHGSKVRRLLGSYGLDQVELMLLDDARTEDDAYIEQQLASLRARAPFDALLLSSDPRTRRPYFAHACAHRCAVLTDKPVFARDGMIRAEAIATAYLDELLRLAERVRAAGIECVVQAQRRAHPGHRFLAQVLDDAVARVHVPVTSVQVHHADGMWVMPGEWERDHHPYKHGFGKLFHSGYHFVDVLTLLLRRTILLGGITGVEAAVSAARASEVLELWTDHPLLPQGMRCPPPGDRSGHGEQDVHALIDFRGAGGVVTRAQLALLQHSLSDRSPLIPVTEPYKGAGRVRHERVDAHVGPLVNVQLHSYQSRSTRESEGDGVGESDHFEVLVFRNARVTGEKPFERHTLSALEAHAARVHNERARGELFWRFLRRLPTESELEEHLLTGELVALLYRAMAAGKGHIGIARGPLISLAPGRCRSHVE